MVKLNNLAMNSVTIKMVITMTTPYLDTALFTWTLWSAVMELIIASHNTIPYMWSPHLHYKLVTTTIMFFIILLLPWQQSWHHTTTSCLFQHMIIIFTSSSLDQSPPIFMITSWHTLSPHYPAPSTVMGLLITVNTVVD